MKLLLANENNTQSSSPASTGLQLTLSFHLVKMPRTLSTTPLSLHTEKIPNMRMHNFCSVLQPPKSTINLLGLGHNVCIALMRPPGNLKTPLLCFKRNLRIKEWVLNNNMKHEDEAYNPKVYIKSIWDPPPVQKNSNRHLETSKPWVMNSTKGISSIAYIFQTLFLTPLLWAETL